MTTPTLSLEQIERMRESVKQVELLADHLLTELDGRGTTDVIVGALGTVVVRAFAHAAMEGGVDQKIVREASRSVGRFLDLMAAAEAPEDVQQVLIAMEVANRRATEAIDAGMLPQTASVTLAPEPTGKPS